MIIKFFKEKPTIPLGSKRHIRKFLKLPKIINGEFRWLETCTWEEKAMPLIPQMKLIPPMLEERETANYKWKSIRWVD